MSFHLSSSVALVMFTSLLEICGIMKEKYDKCRNIAEKKKCLQNTGGAKSLLTGNYYYWAAEILDLGILDHYGNYRI